MIYLVTCLYPVHFELDNCWSIVLLFMLVHVYLLFLVAVWLFQISARDMSLLLLYLMFDNMYCHSVHLVCSNSPLNSPLVYKYLNIYMYLWVLRHVNYQIIFGIFFEPIHT